MSSSGKKVVLITGGTGLVGSGIRASIERDGARDDETFIYLSSKDANLQYVRKIFLQLLLVSYIRIYIHLM